jgi:hypothetical protein
MLLKIAIPRGRVPKILLNEAKRIVAGLAPRPPIAIGSLVEGCNPLDLPAFAAGLTVWIAAHNWLLTGLVCQNIKKEGA